LAGASIDAMAVRSYLGQHLARYKVPKVVELSALLPREDLGKIFKRKLRAPYWEKAGRSESVAKAADNVTLFGKLKSS
jgi:long-chain acyl-CoA synthetase